MNSERKGIDIEAVMRCFESPIHRNILCNLGQMGEGTARDLLSRPIGASQASLYRALNALESEGFIKVVSEERKRAVTERTYGLSKDFTDFMDSVFQGNDRDTYRVMVAWGFNRAQSEFEEYLSRDDANIVRDMPSIASIEIDVTDEELGELHSEIRSLLGRYVKGGREGATRTVTMSIGPPRRRDE